MVQPFQKTVWQFLNKAEHFILWSSNCTTWYLPKWAEALFPNKNLHLKVCNSLTHNCQKWDVLQVRCLSGEGRSKSWYSHTWNIISAKKYEQSSYKETWKNFKCMVLRSKRPVWKGYILCRIPPLWHSGKGKTMKTDQWLPGMGSRGWKSRWGRLDIYGGKTSV